jgi:hypothetical protein
MKLHHNSMSYLEKPNEDTKNSDTSSNTSSDNSDRSM